jgi:hypothetical protein
MKYHALSLVLLFIFLIHSVNAQEVTGNDLNKWADADDRVQQNRQSVGDIGDAYYLMGYTRGIYDANRQYICHGTPITVGQMMAVVKKYVRQNPENWNLKGPEIVLLALAQAFPCSKK